jgi:hypothetical protein
VPVQSMEGLGRMDVGGEKFRRVARKNENKGKRGLFQAEAVEVPRAHRVARKNVNKGKHETFQAI